MRWRERLLDVAARLFPLENGSSRAAWSSGATILLYHRVIPDKEPSRDPFAVRQSLFARQMEWLSRAGSAVSLDRLAIRIREHQDVAGLVAVTFDDGYDCTFSRAWPILQRHGTPATVFLDTARVGCTPDALRPEQIRQMAGAGIEFGSHARSHRDLRTLSNNALQEELLGSREEIEAWTGRPVTKLAYPYGRYDDRIREFAARAGYDCACTCRQERSNHPGDDLLTLRRVEINLGDDWHRFKRKLAGDYAGVYFRLYRLSQTTR